MTSPGNLISKNGRTKALIDSLIDYVNAPGRVNVNNTSSFIYVNNPRARLGEPPNDTSSRPPVFDPGTGSNAHFALNRQNATDRRFYDMTSRETRIDAGVVDQVNTLGNRISASSLVDVLLIFGHQLTRARTARFVLRRAGPDSIEGEQITMFANTSAYRMNAAAFMNAVRANPNPLNALQTGQPATYADLETLVARIQTVIGNHMTSSAVVVSYCHSNCHGNCHGNRNRR